MLLRAVSCTFSQKLAIVSPPFRVCGGGSFDPPPRLLGDPPDGHLLTFEGERDRLCDGGDVRLAILVSHVLVKNVRQVSRCLADAGSPRPKRPNRILRIPILRAVDSVGQGVDLGIPSGRLTVPAIVTGQSRETSCRNLRRRIHVLGGNRNRSTDQAKNVGKAFLSGQVLSSDRGLRIIRNRIAREIFLRQVLAVVNLSREVLPEQLPNLVPNVPDQSGRPIGRFPVIVQVRYDSRDDIDGDRLRFLVVDPRLAVCGNVLLDVLRVSLGKGILVRDALVIDLGERFGSVLSHEVRET